ncbi:OmpA family protein [Roseateles sp. BYS87W]|uniref:OmpA family protein n=1 Tax=Pelomonas baiyunensis TaxID=3299026 RepID=A0ABW7H4B7_9BURK
MNTSKPFGAALLWAAVAVAHGPVVAQPVTAGAKPVVVSGTVPDEATRSAILQRVREVYGTDRQVVDQLAIGKLSAPASWAPQVAKLITPELRQVSQGELRVSGTTIDIEGQVANAGVQQKLGSQLNAALVNTTYSVRNGLRVGGGQAQLDAALADRIVEFEPAKDTLTLEGQRILDELLPVLQQFNGRRFEVIGHTDNAGVREANVALSQARAEAVKRYLVERGLPAASIVTRGAGPDRPIADNANAQGRARNRRIEFRVLA